MMHDERVSSSQLSLLKKEKPGVDQRITFHKLMSHRKCNKCLTNQGATGNVTRLVWFT
jgi:hypothetical protein